jgi:hypothetical protein
MMTLLITAACRGHLSATPMTSPIHKSDPLPGCTVPAPLWVEDFTLPDCTSWDDGPTAWTQYNGSPAGTFAVYNNEFKANNLTVNGASIWRSDILNIPANANIRISVDVRSEGELESNASTEGDFIKLCYKLNGGDEVLIAQVQGKINNNSNVYTTLSAAPLAGLTGNIQIYVRVKATAADEYYYLDNVKIIKEVAVNIQPTAAALQQLSCAVGSVELSGGSAIANASYAWTGPNGFTASGPGPTVNTAGDYILQVTDPASGCQASATVTVIQDIAAPASVTANPSSVLTCAQTSVTMTGNSTTSGVSYAWSGPNGFSSALRVATTPAPGAYTLTVTNPVNGCTAVKAITVRQDIAAPADVSIATPDLLTCAVGSVTLSGGSSTANTLYIWSGPDDFSDVVPVTTVSAAGEYSLTVVNAGNSCSVTVTVTVHQDLTGCEAFIK